MISGTSSNRSAISSIQPLLVLNSDSIHANVCQEYKQLIDEAKQYENIYETVDVQRKQQLKSPIQDLMNKLHIDTSQLLTHKFFEFLSGHEQHMGEQVIRVSNEAERLVCLSILTKVIIRQLRCSDLTDIKSTLLLPLISEFSGSIENKEFTTIFLEHLHIMCPYTVPYYPTYESTMTCEQKRKTIGYIEKHDGTQYRLETRTEFLNRMSGLIRLFCKLLVYHGPPFNKNLAFAWKWFANVLNLPPRSEITTLLIRIFLNEAGNDMNRVYPNQFPKLILTIQTKYLPIMKSEMSDDQVVRLQSTLDEFSRNS